MSEGYTVIYTRQPTFTKFEGVITLTMALYCRQIRCISVVSQVESAINGVLKVFKVVFHVMVRVYECSIKF